VDTAATAMFGWSKTFGVININGGESIRRHPCIPPTLSTGKSAPALQHNTVILAFIKQLKTQV